MIRMSDVRKVSTSRGVAKKTPSVTDAPSMSPEPIKNDVGQNTTKEVLDAASLVNATAVHIEPSKDDAVVRYRVDGMLRSGKNISPKDLADVTRYIKSASHLDQEEDRVPQEGHFELQLAAGQFAIRASLLPVADGEKIVLHLRHQNDSVNDLQKLGFWGQPLAAINGALQTERGLVVVTGPNGSGKTATMYGMLHKLASPNRTLTTVEDAIEHRLPGVNQSVVNTKAGVTFNEVLKAVVRQDPNVIMVSDVREPETASTVVHEAISGHLIIAGLHFRNVASALSHLNAMGVEPYLLASAVSVVVNQRLVRRLCQDCREPYKPSIEEFTAACHSTGLNPHGVVGYLMRLESESAKAFAVNDDQRFKDGALIKLWRAKDGGCNKCGHTGYSGRIALCEAIPVSQSIQKLIFAASPPVALYNQAIADGVVPLPIDGFLKATLGITSLQEVLRAVAE